MAESGNRARALRLLAGGAIGGGLAWLACLAGFGLALGASTLPWVLLGGATTMVFFAIGQLVQVLAADADAVVVTAASLVSYLVRVAGLVVVLVLAQPLLSGPGARALGLTMIAVAVGWLAVEIWTFRGLRVLDFDPPNSAGH